MNMKKTFLMIVFAAIFATSAFAANTYVVESVTGKVTSEAAPGSWKNVTVGQELSDSVVVNTGLNSTLVVDSNGTKITIKAMQKGALDGLLAAAGGVKRSCCCKRQYSRCFKRFTERCSYSFFTCF